MENKKEPPSLSLSLLHPLLSCQFFFFTTSPYNCLYFIPFLMLPLLSSLVSKQTTTCSAGKDRDRRKTFIHDPDSNSLSLSSSLCFFMQLLLLFFLLHLPSSSSLLFLPLHPQKDNQSLFPVKTKEEVRRTN